MTRLLRTVGWLALLMTAMMVCSCQDKDDREIADIKHAVWDFRARIILSRTPQQERETLEDYLVWASRVNLRSRWIMIDAATGKSLEPEDARRPPEHVSLSVKFYKQMGPDRLLRIVYYEFPLKFNTSAAAMPERYGP